MDVCNNFHDIRSGERLRSQPDSSGTSVSTTSKDLPKSASNGVLGNEGFVSLNVQDDVIVAVFRAPGDFGDPVRPTWVGSISEACRYVMITARLNHVFVVCSYDHLF